MPALTVASPGETSRDVHIHRILVVHDTSDVAHRRMDEFRLFAHLASPLALERRKRTRVFQPLHCPNFQIARSGYMNLCVPRWEVRPAKIPVERDGPVDLWVLPDRFSGSEILQAVGEEVRVLIPEHERPELHDRDESREEVDLAIGVSTVEHTGEGEELGALVDLGPESVLEAFLGVFESRSLLDEVHVGKEADDFGETVRLEHVEKLECFLQPSTP
jgi:hypothetical protein